MTGLIKREGPGIGGGIWDYSRNTTSCISSSTPVKLCSSNVNEDLKDRDFEHVDKRVDISPREMVDETEGVNRIYV